MLQRYHLLKLKQLLESELIVNKNGSVYHLGLQVDQLADSIITVGDPARVKEVAQHLDRQYFSIQNREFNSVGGELNGKNILIISTGIGTDNVDIVFNELAFLANYDLTTREPYADPRKLKIFRLGTSGSVSDEFQLGDIVYSKYAISFDDLFWFYNHSFDHLSFEERRFPVIPCSEELEKGFTKFKPSLTLTAKGFYGPQFRQSQLQPKYTLNDVNRLSYRGIAVGNIEMETAGIYGMSKLLGFEAMSINALLADRRNGAFHSVPEKVISKMIVDSLEQICL